MRGSRLADERTMAFQLIHFLLQRKASDDKKLDKVFND
jgi:hypothetical protein